MSRITTNGFREAFTVALSDIPNIGKITGRQLIEAGIQTPEEA